MDHHQLVIQVCAGLLTTHSSESGALKQRNIQDMQDSGPPGLVFDTPVLNLAYARIQSSSYITINVDLNSYAGAQHSTLSPSSNTIEDL